MGNVITDATTGDAAGADGASVTAIEYDGMTYTPGDTINTPNGTMVINANGSYTYTPNDSVNDEVTDTFTYTLTDGDGDQDTADLVVTFDGDANIPTAGPSTANIDDDGIAGSNPAPTADDLDANIGDLDGALSSEASFSGVLNGSVGLDNPGTFDFAAMNLAANSTATVGQETVSYSWVGTTLTATITSGDRAGDPLFTVEITDTATGAYTVTLLTNVLHDEANNGETGDLVIPLTYTVTDSDNSTESSTLTITFDDDMPTLGTMASLLVYNTDVAPNNYDEGSTSLVFGADGAATIGGITITPPAIDGITYVYTPDGDGIGMTVTGQSDDGTDVFAFHVGADGTYDFTLITPDAGSTNEISLNNLAAGNSDFAETGGFELEFSSPSSDPINVSTAGFAPDGQWFNPGETMLLEFYNDTALGGNDTPDMTLDVENLINSVSFSVNVQGNFNNEIGDVVINYTATNTITGEVVTGTALIDIEYDTNGVAISATAIVDPGIEFNTLVLSNGDTTNGSLFRLNTPTTSQNVLPEGFEADFQVTITDGDGDVSATETVHVTVDASSAPPMTMRTAAPEEMDMSEALFASLADDMMFDQISVNSGSLRDMGQMATIMAGLMSAEQVFAAEPEIDFTFAENTAQIRFVDSEQIQSYEAIDTGHEFVMNSNFEAPVFELEEASQTFNEAGFVDFEALELEAFEAIESENAILLGDDLDVATQSSNANDNAISPDANAGDVLTVFDDMAMALDLDAIAALGDSVFGDISIDQLLEQTAQASQAETGKAPETPAQVIDGDAFSGPDASVHISFDDDYQMLQMAALSVLT